VLASLLLLLTVGCERDASTAGALPALRPLDAVHAAEFVQAFDEAKDRPRYVVALSPT
jgi:hypothetical protein